MTGPCGRLGEKHHPGERDRRKRVLSLTKAGARRVAEARPLHVRAQTELTSAFGLDRAGELIDELRALVGADP